MLPLLTKLVECTPPPQVESVETAPDFSMLVSIIESDPKVHMGKCLKAGRTLFLFRICSRTLMGKNGETTQPISDLLMRWSAALAFC